MCEVQLTTHTTHASGITLQSAAVRRKPNAFNLLHQLELERRAKGASDNTLEAWLYIDVLAFSEMFEADCRALLPGLGKQHGICGSVQDWQVGEPSGDEPVQPCTKQIVLKLSELIRSLAHMKYQMQYVWGWPIDRFWFEEKI